MANTTSTGISAATDSDERVITLPAVVYPYECIRSATNAAIWLAVVWALRAWQSKHAWTFTAAVVLTVAIALFELVEIIFRNRWRVRNFRSVLQADAFHVHSGRWLAVEHSVRVDAVLSVDVRTGPLLRHWGLAHVKLHGIAHFLTLPPFPQADALAVQSTLTAHHDEPSS